MKIHELLGATPLKNDKSKSSDELSSQCFVGVEVELERAHSLLNKNWEYWSLKGDGSLRDEGIEIVFNRPYQGTDIILALDEMQSNIEGTPVQCTEYCSTHLHMNFLSSTPDEVMNFLCLYLLFEDGLARFCGPNRENNLFCLTVSNAEEQLEVYRQMYRNRENNILRPISRRGGQRALKYSALNIAALTQYGTIESRLMYGIKEKGVLLRWMNTLMRIRTHALRMNSVQDILVEASAQGLMAFVQEVLGDTLNAEEFFRENELYDAIDRVQYVLTGH